MTLIRIPKTRKAVDPLGQLVKRSAQLHRRPAPEVLGAPNAGPSPRGSTFYARMRSCPREHALYHLARLRQVTDNEALTVGWLFHYGLEAYYRHIWTAQQAGAKPGDQKVIADAEKVTFEGLQALADEPGYDDTYPKVESMLGSYCDRYRRDAWRIVAVEETLEVFDPITYSCRLDLVVENSSGLWEVEHKTARYFGASVVEGYQLNWQVVGQVYALRQVIDLEQYPPFKGVLVNLTSKHSPPRHLRLEVTPSQAHLDAFEDMVATWSRMLPIYGEQGWPADWTSCAGARRGYARCQYFDLCYAYPNTTINDWMTEEPPYGFTRLNELEGTGEHDDESEGDEAA